MNLASRCEIGLVNIYRTWRSGHLSPCRFVPSCSQYALDALNNFGFIRANRLIIGRLLRCHPWGGWGADPIPTPSQSKKVI